MTPGVRLPAGLAAVLLLLGCTATVPGHGTRASRGPAGASPSSAAAPSPGDAPTVPAPPPADFTDCTDRLGLSASSFPAGRLARLRFGCAQVRVPLDYRHPSGAVITLQLLKVHSLAAPAATPLLVNPGGPGGSGVELALGLATEVSDRLLGHFDLLGFDPRGVGLSAPLSCVSNAEKDTLNAASPDVLTAAGFAQAKQLAQAVADACASKYGPALAEYNTEQTAMDMEQIRLAVGGQPLSYLGFSYGTELGAAYAHLYPAAVRVAVLDGAVDPLTDDLVAAANQLKGFEGAFDQFAADCAARPACAPLGNPRSVVYQLVRTAQAAPIRSSRAGEQRTATPALVLLGVVSALYSRDQWAALGNALLAARSGDAKGLLALADQYNQRSADGSYTNLAEANTAISCNDAKPGPSDATIRSSARAWAGEYPMFGTWFAASLFSCQVWQPQRTPVPVPTAATARPVLVLGNLHDPATPYHGAQDLVQALGHATLLTWDGEGHTSYLMGSRCVDSYVDSYLITATPPPPATTCPAVSAR